MSQSIRIAILVRKNYWSLPPQPGNGATHRSVPDICAAIGRAGGEAVVIEPDSQTMGAFHGLVLPGGGDIHPHFYGQVPDGLEGWDPEFDAFQLSWTRRAVRAGLPILGICRGLQLLNVAAGGSLIQDLPRHGLDHAPRRVVEDARLRGEAVHTLETAPGSRLRRTLGARAARVNSIHHQAVDRLAATFAAVAWAEDGTVEAIESIQAPWQRGVQFHPEDMRELPVFQGLFDELVEDASSSFSQNPTGELI